jgi:hypothetical protein
LLEKNYVSSLADLFEMKFGLHKAGETIYVVCVYIMLIAAMKIYIRFCILQQQLIEIGCCDADDVRL